MAAAARLSLFHVSHADPYAPFAGDEYLIVAFNTFIHTLMVGVVKYRVPGLLDLENYIYGRFMTCITITFYTEYSRAVVAAAAGSPFFHLRHGKSLITRAGVVHFVMAIRTGVCCEMLIMVEAGVI